MTKTFTSLASLSSAEEFFLALGLPFEQRVLDVYRLHILNQFRRYLAASGAKDSSDMDIARQCLSRAYGDFAKAHPAAKTFKVFQPAGGFVPLSALARKEVAP